MFSQSQEPCRSGLQPGARPGPYSQIVATGPHRGESFCFICDTGDKPAVIIFARTPSDSLGKLVHGIDVAIGKYPKAMLCSWVTFLDADQPGLDAKLLKWGQQHTIKTVPLAVVDDLGGPPSYRLSREADVTVLLSVNQKVTVNFAFREGELTDGRIEGVLKAVEQLDKKRGKRGREALPRVLRKSSRGQRLSRSPIILRAGSPGLPCIRSAVTLPSPKRGQTSNPRPRNRDL